MDVVSFDTFKFIYVYLNTASKRNLNSYATYRLEASCCKPVISPKRQQKFKGWIAFFYFSFSQFILEDADN